MQGFAFLGTLTAIVDGQRECFRIVAITSDDVITADIAHDIATTNVELAGFMAATGIPAAGAGMPTEAAVAYLAEKLDGLAIIIHSSDQNLAIVRALQQALAENLNPPIVSSMALNDKSSIDSDLGLAKANALKEAYLGALSASENTPLPHQIGGQCENDQIKSASIAGPFMTETWESEPSLIDAGLLGIGSLKGRAILTYTPSETPDKVAERIVELGIADEQGNIL